MVCCKNTSKPKKMAIFGGVTMGVGILLLIVAIVFPLVITRVLEEQIPPSVAVSKQNEEQWNALPGKFDIEVIKRIYLYNCTNPEEVSLPRGFIVDRLEFRLL